MLGNHVFCSTDRDSNGFVTHGFNGSGLRTGNLVLCRSKCLCISLKVNDTDEAFYLRKLPQL